MGGSPYDWTPDEEDQLLSEIAQFAADSRRYVEEATESQADTLAELSTAYPNAHPSYLTSAAMAIDLGAMTMDEGLQLVQDTVQAELDEIAQRAVEEDPNPSFLSRLWNPVWGGVKKTVQTGVAGLTTIEQLGTSLLTRAGYELVLKNKWGRDPETGELLPEQTLQGPFGVEYTMARPTSSVSSIFKTTDFGQLLSGADPGEGFFVADEARAQQEQAAIAYRGGVVTGEGEQRNVVGLTAGRGIAGGVFEPGTMAYNTLSGSVDATWALGAPTGVGVAGKVVRRGGEGLSAVSKGQFRSLNGLTNNATPYIQSDRVLGWLNSSSGQRLVQNVVNVDNIEDARRLLPNATARTWNDLVKASSDTEAFSLLSRTLGAEKGAMSLSDVNWSRWSDVKENVLSSAVPRLMGIERAVTRQPGRRLVVGFATDAEITETVKNAEDWFKLLGVKKSERTDLLNRFTNAILEDKADVDNIVRQLEEVFTDSLSRRGVQPELMKGLFTRHIQEIRDVNRYNIMDDEGVGDIFDLASRQMMFVDDVTGEIFSGTPQRATGWFDSEHRRWTIEMPDPRAVQRITKPVNWVFTRRGVTKAGKSIDNPQLPQEFLDKAGRPMMPTALLDNFHNVLWKKGALGTGGYGFRIALEGMMRQLFSPGIRAGVMHPWEFLSSMMFRKGFGKYKGSVTGDLWEEGLDAFKDKDAEAFFNENFQEMIDFVTGGMKREIDAGVVEKTSYKLGSWGTASRNDPEYVQAIADNIHLAANDRLTRLVAQGYSADDIIQMAQDGDRVVLQALRDLETRHANKVVTDWNTGAQRAGSMKLFDDNDNILEFAVRDIIDGYTVPRLARVTAGDRRLTEIIANGDNFGTFDPSGTGEQISAFLYRVEGMFGPEARGDYADEFMDAVREVLGQNPDAFPNLMKYRINVAGFKPDDIPAGLKDLYRRGDEWVRQLFADLLTKPDQYLNRSPVWRRFYYEGIDLLLPQLDEGEAIKIVENVREAFLRPVLRERAKWSGAKLDAVTGKYKVGKKMYTKAEVDANITKIDAKLKARQTEFTDAWAGRYIGRRETWDRIKDMADGKLPATGSRTVEDINELARGFAADQSRRLLYDASEKSNFAAMFGVVSPFYTAWREGVTRWPRMMLSQPDQTRRLFRSFQGLADADPDNNGQGFIYRHPTTNEMVFDYPFEAIGGPTMGALLFGAGSAIIGGGVLGVPGMVAGAVGGGVTGYQLGSAAEEAGVSVSMVAPAKSLNIALTATPGLGPGVQIPLSWVLDRNWIPKSDDISRFLLPFGAPDSPLTPSWLAKFTDVFESDPNQARYYSDLKIQSYDALYMTGKYDRNDPQQMADLEADASAQAKYLLMLRSFGQFVGAARPVPELNIPTRFEGQITIDDVELAINEGDIRNVVLTRTFRLLQEEDYSTATRRFLELFGDESVAYLVGKTYTNVDGLQSSREFGDWELANPDIVNNAKEVFPYFAGDVGSTFDFYTYRRHIGEDNRGRYTDPKERLEAAEYEAGRALYMEAVRNVGPNPNPLQQQTLREYRTYLQQTYPGFGLQPTVTDGNLLQIRRLEDAVQLDATQNNRAADGMREYFAFRDDALRIIADRRINAGEAAGDKKSLATSLSSSTQHGDLRGVLRMYGFYISEKNPDFARVWNDVLFSEVDLPVVPEG